MGFAGLPSWSGRSIFSFRDALSKAGQCTGSSSLGTPRVTRSTSGTCGQRKPWMRRGSPGYWREEGEGVDPGGGPTHLVSWWVPRQRTVQYRAPQLTQV